jgi:hypothetical protein
MVVLRSSSAANLDYRESRLVSAFKSAKKGEVRRGADVPNFRIEFAAARNYHCRTRERRLIHKMKNSDSSGKREVAEA